MTVQELQEVMSQRFDRVEDDVKELGEKLDKLLELQHYQQGSVNFQAVSSNMPHGWDQQSSRLLHSSKVSFRGMQC